MFPFKYARTSQPQGAVGVDWSNPLCKSITGLWNFNSKNIVDAVSGVSVSVNDTANVLVKSSLNGLGPASISPTNGRYINTNRTLSQLGIGGNSDRTVFGVASFDPSVTNAPIFVVGVPSSGNQDWSLRKKNSSANDWRFNIFGVISIDFTYSLSANDPVVFVCTQKGTAVEVWINGALRGSGTATVNTTASNLYFLSDPVATTWASYGYPVHQVGTARTAWGTSEKRSFSANPWQIFAPVTRPIWVAPSTSVVSISRPNSDVTTTGWTGNPDNVTLFNNIDESAASDTDYITSPTITGGENIIFGITPTIVAGTWDVRYRANFVGSSAQVRITLLDSGGASVGVSSWQTVTSTYTLYTASVTTTGTAARVKIEVQ